MINSKIMTKFLLVNVILKGLSIQSLQCTATRVSYLWLAGQAPAGIKVRLPLPLRQISVVSVLEEPGRQLLDARGGPVRGKRGCGGVQVFLVEARVAQLGGERLLPAAGGLAPLHRRERIRVRRRRSARPPPSVRHHLCASCRPRVRSHAGPWVTVWVSAVSATGGVSRPLFPGPCRLCTRTRAPSPSPSRSPWQPIP